MLNVEKLPRGMVRDIAQNMGYDSGDDLEAYKTKIAELTEEQALRCYCAWHLGSYSWADFFLEAQKNLQEAKVS